MTRHAFSVFSTDSERSDRSVHKNIFFSENATWFVIFFSEKWEIWKKISEKIENFGFLVLTFFENLFFKTPPQFFAQNDSTSIAVLPSTLGGLEVHYRNFLGQLFHKNHQNLGFFKIFVLETEHLFPSRFGVRNCIKISFHIRSSYCSNFLESETCGPQSMFCLLPIFWNLGKLQWQIISKLIIPTMS